jgi:two-component system response regulator DesR
MVEPIRILLVEIPTLSRRCLAALLNRRRGFRVVGEAASGPHALEQARRLAPDIALVEPAVPGGGPRLVAQLCRDTPCGAVLVLTLGGAAGAARRALEAGARGYLEKDCEPEELVRAIERVRAGDLIVAQAAADAVLRGLGDPAGGRRAAALTTSV